MALRKLKKIAAWVGAEAHWIKPETEISHLLFDSRRYRGHTQTLFFALRGDHHNGHDYINELCDKGVRNFVVEQVPPGLKGQANFLLVEDSFKALQQLAQKIREGSKANIIGITGSNGKTITKEWLYHLLRPAYRVTRNPKSYNSQLGVPLSVWRLGAGDDYGLFEAGISRPEEMARLEKILRPAIGIFTNIGSAHQENFATLRQKIDEKLRLFYRSRYLVYCRDHKAIGQAIAETEELQQTELFSWSWQDESATVWVKGKRVENGITRLHYRYKGDDYQAVLPFADAASQENALHALCAALLTGLKPEVIAQGLSDLEPVAMRLELKKGQHGNIIINDAYNADLESLRIALEYFSQQAQQRQKILIMSDILQSGRAAKELYHLVGEMLQRFELDRVITVGEQSQELQKHYGGQLQTYASTEALLKTLAGQQWQNSAILLKGARAFHFEKIDALLEEKTHETILEINLSRMVANLNYYRKMLQPGVKIMAMVKAFGYGSGSHEIAGMLQFHKVDYLAVAYTDEGVELRQAGIHLPIMVLNPEISSLDELLEYELEPEVYSFRLLKAVGEKVKMQQLEAPYPIHLKLETGMHRLGFEENELPELAEQLKAMPHLRMASAFSHLAAADETEQREFSLEQIRGFERMTQILRERLQQKFSRHILNSSGISQFPQAQFEMVRLGIGLYGISADEAERQFLKPVGTLKATVSQLKHLQPGDTVGYGRTFKAERPMTTATLSIGYADGFRRSLGNGIGEVVIKGQRYKTLGRVCMDMIMVDVTGSEVQAGDEVEIIGPVISVYELAEKMGTIPYEVLTGISQRVKRVYLVE